MEDNPKDFKEFVWLEHKVDDKLGDYVEERKEMIHKDILDIFFIFGHYNARLDGLEIIHVVNNHPNYSRLTKRAAHRKYGRAHKIEPKVIDNIVKAHDVLTKAGHGRIVENIYQLFHKPHSLLVGNAISTIKFIQDIGLFDKFNDELKQIITNNLEEFETFNLYKSINWNSIRTIDENTLRVKVSRGLNRKPKILYIHTFEKIDDIGCKINDTPYNYDDLQIILSKQ